MKPNSRIVLSLAIMAVLSACSSAPPRIESLEMARALVSQVESSPRAGVAAANVSKARKSLDAANRMALARAKLPDIQFEAQNAITSAQIANEKILTAQAQEQIESGNVQRQALLLEARGSEAQQNAQQASDAGNRAEVATRRADALESEVADLKAKRAKR